MQFVDLSYYANTDSLQQAVSRMGPVFSYLSHLKEHFRCMAVLHASGREQMEKDGVGYQSFRGRNTFFYLPSQTYRYLAKWKPRIILVQGLHFPVQVIFLRLRLGKAPVIMVQHHGGRPFAHPVKRYFQKIADRCIDGYFFTSLANAGEWIESGVIAGKEKCFEVLECSTYMQRKDKAASKAKLGMTGTENFLWVGRLNANKDPLTVLRGFSKYLGIGASARLYMVYQEEELLDKVKAIINGDDRLRSAVTLVGRVPHEGLADWFSAADFYISGSHHEGSGYALIEAMACGCIPVVTDIPPFRTITDGGRLAFLYKAGDADALCQTLCSPGIDRQHFSEEVYRYFITELSFEKISDTIYATSMQLLAAKQ